MTKPEKSKKFEDAIKHLGEALQFREQAKSSHVYYSALAKCFEVCLEYAWKYFKATAEDEGIDVYTPKDALRIAGRIGMIDNVEQWISFINTRNKAVHDYLDISREAYLEIIAEFYQAVKLL